MKKVTIQDIAKEAGVSKAAVSYVLNNKKGVNEKTREKIEQLVVKYDYRPNLRSRSLSLGKNYCLHAVIRQEAAPACKAFYFNVIAQMVDQEKGNFSIVPVFQSDDTESDESLTEIILSKSTDGVIAFQGVTPDIEALLEKHNIPLVLINPGIDVTDTTAVILDFEKLAYQATSFLVAQGHHKIGMIGMACMPLFYSQTVTGYLQALKAADISANESWVRGEADCEAGAARAMEQILKQDNLPTAIFCVQDNFAMSAMSVCHDHGLAVPQDMSFIAIDDVPEARYYIPSLTTIPVSPAKIAKTALMLILDKIKDGSPTSVALPPQKIVVRDSVTQPKPL